MTSSTPAPREPVDVYLKRILGATDDIKPGREARILAEDTALAHMVASRLESEPLIDGVTAPITHAIPTSQAPVEYIIHIWTHKCSICHTEHKHSEVFALNRIRTGYRGTDGLTRPGSTWVRNMTPVAKLEWQVPLRVIPLTTRTTAGCFECLEALREEILPTLPLPPVPQAISNGLTTGREPSTRTEAKKGKTLSSTDDFML